MTHQEKIIVSAYTGVLMCDFSDVHKYIEEKMGRPVWTHEMADPKIQSEIYNATREDFLALCRDEAEMANTARPEREECEEREQGLCPFYAG